MAGALGVFLLVRLGLFVRKRACFGYGHVVSLLTAELRIKIGLGFSGSTPRSTGRVLLFTSGRSFSTGTRIHLQIPNSGALSKYGSISTHYIYSDKDYALTTLPK